MELNTHILPLANGRLSRFSDKLKIVRQEKMAAIGLGGLFFAFLVLDKGFPSFGLFPHLFINMG